MTFGCYKRLTAKQKATYRRSDEVTAVADIDAPALSLLVVQLDAALTNDKRLATAKAASSFALPFCTRLDVSPVRITVRLVRPEIRGGVLHGVYRFVEGKRAPTIDVWMTATPHRAS